MRPTRQLTDINKSTTPPDRHSVPEALNSKYDSITVMSLVAALDSAIDDLLRVAGAREHHTTTCRKVVCVEIRA